MDEVDQQPGPMLAIGSTLGTGSTLPATAASQGLNCDAILAAEYQYIAETAFQANEDRSRVTSFYLVTLGSFIAAIFSSTQIKDLDRHAVYVAFCALFLVLTAMSLLTLLQLLRLREAWFDSAAALNDIKAYYIKHSEASGLEAAFRWKQADLPRTRFKAWSVGFLLALQVAVLGGACAGAAVMFGGLAVNENNWWWGPAGIVLAVAAAGQVLLYRHVLLRSSAGSPPPGRSSRR